MTASLVILIDSKRYSGMVPPTESRISLSNTCFIKSLDHYFKLALSCNEACPLAQYLRSKGVIALAA